MLRAGRVIVTRPLQDAARWVQQLQSAGFEAVALPLIDIAASRSPSDTEALRNAWQHLGGYAACMFVSANAVAHFFRIIKAADQSIRVQAAINKVANIGVAQLPPGMRFLAPGPGTKAALLAHGVAAAQIDAPLADAAQFDSEALWQLVGQRDWHGCKVLIVRGKTETRSSDASGDAAVGDGTGRDWLARQWQAAGSKVDVVCVYQRYASVLTPQQLELARSASQDASVWLFSSSEAVANLMRQGGLQAMDWQRARAIATHPRILAAVKAAGWGVALASRPALGDIVNALRSIESGPV